MPGDLLLERENTEELAECLERVRDDLRGIQRDVGRIAVRMQGTANWFETVWRQIVVNVANGQTEAMQAERPRLLERHAKRFALLRQAHLLIDQYHKEDESQQPEPDLLLSELADMERFKTRVLDRWLTAEDLEDLAARDYPLNARDLERVGSQRRPSASWYSEEGKPF